MQKILRELQGIKQTYKKAIEAQKYSFEIKLVRVKEKL